MYLWKYTINGYSGIEEGEYVHHGLINGGNFTEAVDNLENYYGNEICNLYIECAGEENDPYLLDAQYKINLKEVTE